MTRTVYSDTALGIFAAIGAGFLWGLVFLAPQVLHEFSPYQIMFGRFFFFGLFSLLFLRRVIAIVKTLSWHELLKVLALSFTGFWGYTLSLVWSIQHAGGVLTTLVIGMLPISIAVLGEGVIKSVAVFSFGLFLVIAGFWVLACAPFDVQPVVTYSLSLHGLGGLLFCLVIWTWYGLQNAKFLKSRPDIPSKDFNSLIGVVSGLSVLVTSFFMPDVRGVLSHAHFSLYLFVSAVIGVGSTWLAYWFWNICSVKCAPQVVGPLIVFETVYGVLFTFIYQGRGPSISEGVALTLFALGAIISIRSQLVEKSSA